MLAMLYNYIWLHIDTYKYVYMSYMSVHVYAIIRCIRIRQPRTY